MYTLFTLIFAAFYFVLGEGCFKLEAGFSFEAVLWISVHAFSTIGFGSLAPLQTCTTAQVLILLESFVSLLVRASAARARAVHA